MAFTSRIPEEMRKKYSDRRALDAEDLAVSLDAGRFDVFDRVGHQLKGNAATFGYEPLAELGRKMELAAELQSVEQAMDCLMALKAWVQEQANGTGEDG